MPITNRSARNLNNIYPSMLFDPPVATLSLRFYLIVPNDYKNRSINYGMGWVGFLRFIYVLAVTQLKIFFYILGSIGASYFSFALDLSKKNTFTALLLQVQGTTVQVAIFSFPALLPFSFTKVVCQKNLTLIKHST